MANQNIIAKKKEVVEEITNKVKEAASTVLFEYQGLTVTETMELRRKLRESGSDYKVYKNTLVKITNTIEKSIDFENNDEGIISVFTNDDDSFINKKYTIEPYGIGFRKSELSESLQNKVNNILEDMRRNGSLREIEKK